MAIWFFLTNRGDLEKAGISVPINPSQLMPLVSGAEARKTICNLKKEELFAQACQSKFDVVGKEDIEKISELFDLLNTIQNDKSIPDYERLLLVQAVFAVLPTKDSPQTNLYQPSLLSRLKDYLAVHNIVYAQGETMSEEEFKKMMERDLQNVVGSLPKGDNAWVINMMVSKYSWIDGKPRPLYSHQYGESFDPFPNNPNVNTRDINYNIRSVVGSKASGQTVDVGSSEYKGTSDMMAYSFTIMSWNSREYTGADGPVEEKFLVKRRNFSDSSYQGEHYLASLLDSVKLSSTKRPIESPDNNESKADVEDDQTNVETKYITCEESKKIMGVGGKCQHYTLTDYTKDIEIWCFPTVGTCSDVGCSNEIEMKTRPLDYKMTKSEWKKCHQGI